MSDTTAPGTSGSDRPKGSPAFLIMLVVILGLSLLAGTLAGAGGASIIGGFVALFSLLATMGGPLRADLRRLAVIGPLVAFSAIAPRLLAEVSVPGAFALITVLVFTAGLLPIRARRYDAVALGVGMGALLGYSIPLTSRADGGQLVLAGVVGIVVALVLRVLLGVADPSGPTRKAVAGLLDESSGDFSGAFDMWLSDRPARWLGTVLVAAGRYRLARRVLSASAERAGERDAASVILDEAARRATAIAASVSSKKTVEAVEPESTEPEAEGEGEAVDRAALTGLPLRSSEAMFAALADAGGAIAARDSEVVAIPPGFRRTLSFSAVRAGLRHASVQVRHAIRAAIAVLIALLISLFLPQGDPLLPTLLVTTFAIVQSSWRVTLSRARDRFIGLIAGGILVVLIVLILPEFLWLPIALVGLAVGLWFITARPAVGTAGIIVMSVGLNTELRDLEPFPVIAEYVVLTLLALIVGTVIGFVVIPAWRPPALDLRAGTAVSAASAVLRRLGDESRSAEPSVTFHLLDEAQGAAQQLIPDREKLSEEQGEHLERLRVGLQDLLVTALFATSSSTAESSSSALSAAAQILDGLPVAESSDDDADPFHNALGVLADDVVEQHAWLQQSIRG